MKKNIFVIISLFFFLHSFSQIQIGDNESKIDFTNPKEYTIGGITVSGTDMFDAGAIKQLSGLSEGDKITVPGDKISDAIKKLWSQKLFADISVSATKIIDNTIFLDIKIAEQPRLSRFKFNGVSKSEADNLREDINLYKEKIVTPGLLVTTKNTVKKYFVDKGFLNTEVIITQEKDTVFANHIMLLIDVKKHKKVKIDNININGNTELSDARLKRAMKETKERGIFKPFNGLHKFILSTVKNIFVHDTLNFEQRLLAYIKERIRPTIFKTSKFLEENYEEDKQKLLAKYNEKGYRDAQIASDSMYFTSKNAVNIELNINEGNKYYFRNISWVGNTKYSSKVLDNILGIEKGDIYNQSVLETRLFMNPSGRDVSSLYMDDGYLFFQVTPVEVLVQNDSIDLEIRIYEGQQATINRVYVSGNSKTNDHVVMREIRTKPGYLFSRSDIIRSQRELAQLGYFDPEKLNVNPQPNPNDGTVDIEYIVAEKPSDQIELSGGWGGGRVVGTLGVTFNNFSSRNFFKRGAWTPLPSGDGQRLSVRAQSNGLFFQSYNMSFTEPWLGGKKPNSLSITAWHSNQTNGITKYLKDKDEDGNKVPNPARSSVSITGGSVGLGKRLKWPDDFFTFLAEASFQKYNMVRWPQFIFPDGTANNLFGRVTISRNALDYNPVFHRSGSQVTGTFQFTPIYSAFNNIDYTDPNITAQQRYRWVEYYKWKFTSSWFTTLVSGKERALVLNTRIGFGFLNNYNKSIGPVPFERFYLGGSGLTGFALDGREIIALRGYDDQSISPRTGGSIISKYTMELRYPLSLNPSATIFVLGFTEAGNTWNAFSDYNPFVVKRSAGFGVRIFLPMFGLLGLDYGFRFDDISRMAPLPLNRGQVHFTIGMNLGEL